MGGVDQMNSAEGSDETRQVDQPIDDHGQAQDVEPRLEPKSKELHDLQSQVIGVRDYVRGVVSVLGFVGVVVAIALFGLGLLGVSGIMDSIIEERVQLQLDARIERMISDLDSIVSAGNRVNATAQVSALRVQALATEAHSAVRTVEAVRGAVDALATQSASERGVGEWILGVASLADLELAKSEVARFLRLGNNDPLIYRIGGIFVVTLGGKFTNEQEAQTVQASLEAQLDSNVNLYEVLNHCPYTYFYEQSGFFGCFDTPVTATPTP